MRFTDAYAGSATCSPTRFSLCAGRYPGRTPGGLAEPIGDRTQGLDPDHPTLASLLRKAGYATALIGKWHCGRLPDHSPTRSGWDEFFGNFGGALEYFAKLGRLGDYDLYEGDATYQDLRYYTTVLTERGAEYVARRDGRPWLLNLNFTTPHWPWPTEGDEETAARIAARIRAGDVLGAPLHNGGERFSYQWPLSGGKSQLLEGGIRVPTVLRRPAAVDAGQVSREPVFSPDWTATLLELGGARPDPAHPLDGRSLAGHLLRGEDLPERDLFRRVRGNRAPRSGRWKYYRDANGRGHLCDLVADARGQADLAAARPVLLAGLRSAWERIDGTLLPYPAA